MKMTTYGTQHHENPKNNYIEIHTDLPSLQHFPDSKLLKSAKEKKANSN